MTDTPQQTDQELDAQQVADYLRRHPAFFAEYDELLPELIIPHQPGQAVSLVERQVKLLRERNIDVRHRLNQLMDVARENDRLFEALAAACRSVSSCEMNPETGGRRLVRSEFNN